MQKNNGIAFSVNLIVQVDVINPCLGHDLIPLSTFLIFTGWSVFGIALKLIQSISSAPMLKSLPATCQAIRVTLLDDILQYKQ